MGSRNPNFSPDTAPRSPSPNPILGFTLDSNASASQRPPYGHGSGARIGSSKFLSGDPRTSSTQSLYSNVSESEIRRTLLIVYIHGFYGNDQSFQSFPYHVHSYLRTLLAESHVIHSKIYPRYKTYRAIEVARDNFSEWLQPHESPTTDVVLIGHSMGGLMAADIVLMPNRNPYSQHPFKHRIIGTISMDSPFLGLHPGIIVAGISSLFQPSADSQETPSNATSPTTPLSPASGSASGSTTSFLQPLPDGFPLPSPTPVTRQPTDPSFNPPFWNDKHFKEQPFVKRMLHFVNKHKAEGLVNATAKHVLSHLEYGSCLLDYNGLNTRYNNIRALEDVDEYQALSEGKPPSSCARVRFVNYYTLSTGRAKQPKALADDGLSQTEPSSIASRSLYDESILSREATRDTTTTYSEHVPQSQVSISVEDHSDTGEPSSSQPPAYSEIDSKPPLNDTVLTREESHDSEDVDLARLSIQHVDPVPIDSDEHESSHEEIVPEQLSRESQIEPPDLPPLPELPPRPNSPEFGNITDKDARKQSEKEWKRERKAFEQAVKSRDRAIRERQKLLQKHQKKLQKDSEKAEREAAASIQPAEAGTEVDQLSMGETQELIREAAALEAEKPKKKRKFCTLPKRVSQGSDETWVDVFMDGMDEVGAHCGLFFPGPHYDKLVGDVGSRILGWVQDDLTKRAVMELESQGAPP